ncbi:MAG: alpha/beta fold hydrolase, partial [Myxococcales bacterium]|nr:alpha/beta fold hydrolase [Myxococcales bacterium]
MAARADRSSPPTPSDPPRQFIALPDGPVAWTDEGQGPTLVALHGLPGTARDFRYLAPLLAAHWRVVRIDMPGFGETPVTTAPDPSVEGRARFVNSVLDALDLRRAVLLGHSMGGVVACAVADAAPARVAGLALLSTPGLRAHRLLRRTPFGFFSRLLRRRVVGTAMAPV